MMLTATLLVQWRAEAMVRAFTSDPAVIAVAAQYLRIISWNFVAVGNPPDGIPATKARS